jgi:hypothetical protein
MGLRGGNLLAYPASEADLARNITISSRACGEDRPADATQMRAAANMVKRVDEDSLSVEPSSSVVFDIVETTFCPR